MSKEYDHIKVYIEKSLDNEMRLLISDFAILWNNYEHYLFNEFYSANKINDQILNRNIFYKDKNIVFINELYERIISYFKFRNIEVSVTSLIDSYNIRRNDITDFELERIIYSQDVKDKLHLILLIVGRVRNNMFNGIKIIKDLTYQKELFKISNEVLTFVLDNTNMLVF